MFAFKLDDPVFDAEQLIFIPLHMVLEIFQQFIPEGLSKLVGPILTAINNEVDAANVKLHKELQKLPNTNVPSIEQIQKQLSSQTINKPVYLARLNKETVTDFPNQSNAIILAQDTNVSVPPVNTSKSTNNSTVSKIDIHKRKPLKERLSEFRAKRDDLLKHSIERQKVFGEAYMKFFEEQQKERAQKENDLFTTYTDIRIPPGELFTEKLLVAPQEKLLALYRYSR